MALAGGLVSPDVVGAKELELSTRLMLIGSALWLQLFGHALLNFLKPE